MLQTNKDSSVTIKTLEQLAEEARKRGNRLEVMNGKVYEVSRKLICEMGVNDNGTPKR